TPSFPAFGGGRGAVGYRSVLGAPGQGAPVEVRPRQGGDPTPAAAASNAAGRGAAPTPPPATATTAPPDDRIPGSPRVEASGGRLQRPSGVGYVITSDGLLHVLGLP